MTEPPDLAGPASAAHASLQAVAGFRELPPDQLTALAANAERVRLEVGATLYAEGDASRDLFVVLSGHLAIQRVTPVGSVRLASLAEGELAGEPSFLDGEPSEASLVAQRPTEVLRLPLAPIVGLMDASESLAVALLRMLWRSLAARLRKANAVMMRIMGTADPGGSARQARDTHRVTASPEEKREVLLASGLTASGLDLLATSMRSEQFAANELIVAEGSPGDVLYVVASGQARVSRQVPGVGEEALLFVGRGGVFGEMAFVDGSNRSADVRAHQGDCVVLSINKDRLEEFLTHDAAAASQLLDLVCQTLCSRVRSMGNQLVAWRIMAGFGEDDPGLET